MSRPGDRQWSGIELQAAMDGSGGNERAVPFHHGVVGAPGGIGWKDHEIRQRFRRHGVECGGAVEMQLAFSPAMVGWTGDRRFTAAATARRSGILAASGASPRIHGGVSWMDRRHHSEVFPRE